MIAWGFNGKSQRGNNTYMKCVFIYNPVGGKGKIAKKLDKIVLALKEKYEIVDVCGTKCAGDMKNIARDAVGKYDAIIFAGGDGSFNEVVQGIGDFEELPVLGYIPTGTTNDIAHTLKISKNIKKALKVIQTGKVEKLDCMKVNDRYAMYVVAAGAFTRSTYSTPQASKKRLGWLAYGFEGLKHDLKFQVFNLHCKSGAQELHTDCVLATFMNSRYVAGFKLNKKANLQDGKIEVAVIKQTPKPNFFKKFGALFSVARLFVFGYKSKMKRLAKMQGSSFDVEVNEEVTWNLDGEKGDIGKLHIEVIPQKINMIVPQK